MDAHPTRPERQLPWSADECPRDLGPTSHAARRSSRVDIVARFGHARDRLNAVHLMLKRTRVRLKRVA